LQGEYHALILVSLYKCLKNLNINKIILYCMITKKIPEGIKFHQEIAKRWMLFPKRVLRFFLKKINQLLKIKHKLK